MIYFILISIFFLLLIIYFRIAEYYNIIDKPNERSSHFNTTIRGGGVVYLGAGLALAIINSEFNILTLALFIIGIISFIDDRITLSNRIRILFHLGAVSIVFSILDLYRIVPWGFVPLLYVFVIGIINAYNFMDGINGITGVMTLVILGGLQYVNYCTSTYIDPDAIWLPLLATIVFLYFNFRKNAKCFAGDVGSITVALWIVYLIFSLILITGNYKYILFLAVYGVDSILTIIHRLFLRQNIFKAHRLHFYQLLANEHKVSHLYIATGYGLVQLLIIIIVTFSSLSLGFLILTTVFPLILTYVLIKPKLMMKTAANFTTLKNEN